jgi:chorismate mutase
MGKWSFKIMTTKGIRGAITLDTNSVENLKECTIELLAEMVKRNNISTENISHVIFTTTNDINAEFPAKFARINLGWNDVAMMCFHELDVPNSLTMCLRVLIVLNCSADFIPQFVYLKGASNLR